MLESFLSHQNKKLQLKTLAMIRYYIPRQVSKKACVPFVVLLFGLDTP